MGIGLVDAVHCVERVDGIEEDANFDGKEIQNQKENGLCWNECRLDTSWTFEHYQGGSQAGGCDSRFVVILEQIY